jgi:hypothetical protein
MTIPNLQRPGPRQCAHVVKIEGGNFHLDSGTVFHISALRTGTGDAALPRVGDACETLGNFPVEAAWLVERAAQ